MKTKINKLILLLLVAIMPFVAFSAENQLQIKSTKAERNYINKGNKLYNEKKYGEAEVQYRKAIEANAASAIAQFNLASTLLRENASTQQAKTKGNKAQNQQNEAVSILDNLAHTCSDKNVASLAYYDLGNLAYKQDDYGKAIELYKNALRKNPGNDDARYNLRMAQLKKQQQNNKQNQNKDKNKDKNKEKQKQNQDKQQQNKQNQDKQKQQQGAMSEQNMEQILRTLQNKENDTQKRANERKARAQQAERARTQYKW